MEQAKESLAHIMYIQKNEKTMHNILWVKHPFDWNIDAV